MFRRETLNFLFPYADDLRHPCGVTINLSGRAKMYRSAIASPRLFHPPNSCLEYPRPARKVTYVRTLLRARGPPERYALD